MDKPDQELSDHCIINLKLSGHNQTNKSKGYWKFNANFLINEEYCSNIKKMIEDIKKDINWWHQYRNGNT